MSISRVAVTAALTLAAVAALPSTAARGDGPTVTQTNRANRGPKAALNRPLPEVKFNASSLSDVMDFLSDVSGANLTVDWRQLDNAHVAKDTPITLRMSAGLPLRKVLSLVLKQAATDAPLTYYVDDGVIQVTTQEAEDKDLISRTYGIQDLLFQAPDYNQAPQLDLQSAGQGQSAGVAAAVAVARTITCSAAASRSRPRTRRPRPTGPRRSSS